MPNRRERRALGLVPVPPADPLGLGLYMPRQPDGSPRLLTVKESATATRERTVTAPIDLHETVGRALAEAPSDGADQLVQLIDAGWGSSGHYSPAVLQEAAKGRVFPAGLHLFIDHPGAHEEHDRPERSVRDLAGVLTEDARYDPQRKALVSKVRTFAAYRPLLAEMRDHIGLSIRAAGTAEYGEADGRQGQIITALTEALSVDYVTRAGRGGRILELLESARTVAAREARNIGAWLESRLHLTLTTFADDMYGDGRLTREERITLSGAIGDGLTAYTARVEADAPQLFQRDLWAEPDATVATTEAARLRETTTDQTRRALDDALKAEYGGPDIWVWARHFDPDAALVWFDVNAAEDTATWQQGYTATGDGPDVAVELVGDRTQVVAQTVYTPVPGDTPDDDPGDTDTTESDPGLAEAITTSDVTDGSQPTAPTNPPTEKEPEMSGTQNGPAPGTAGTVTTAPDTATLDANARAAVAEARLAEANARISTMESQAVTLTAERDQARSEVRTVRNVTTAREACTTVLGATDLPPVARQRVVESVTGRVPVTTGGDVDTAALNTAITAAVESERSYIASVREAAGAGTPSGLNTAAPTSFSESAGTPAADAATWQKAVESRLQRIGMDPKSAALAAQGR